jgi:uncharacterized protein YndB with AHSA1/START domain
MIWRVGSVRRETLSVSESTSTGARARVTKIIKAPREAVYRAFIDPHALAAWLPPAGMSGHVHLFEPRAGGKIKMSLTYDNPERSLPGKTSKGTDTFRGRFAELIPHEKIVWIVEFESTDPAFAGEMKMIATLAEVPDGTEIAMACENIPKGIRIEDNVMGCRSSLQNLAALLEATGTAQRDFR